jgi:hypothetical protein
MKEPHKNPYYKWNLANVFSKIYGMTVQQIKVDKLDRKTIR